MVSLVELSITLHAHNQRVCATHAAIGDPKLPAKSLCTVILEQIPADSISELFRSMINADITNILYMEWIYH